MLDARGTEPPGWSATRTILAPAPAMKLPEDWKRKREVLEPLMKMSLLNTTSGSFLSLVKLRSEPHLHSVNQTC